MEMAEKMDGQPTVVGPDAPSTFIGEAHASAHCLLLVGLGAYRISVVAGLDLSGGATPDHLIG